MKKRVIALCLSFVMVLGLFTACNNGAKQESSKAASTSNADMPKFDKKLTISWITRQTTYPYGMDEDGEMLQYWGKMFNVDFKITNISMTDYRKTIDLMFASNDGPDRLDIATADDLAKHQKNGVLAEISEDLMKKYCPNYYSLFIDDSPGILKYGKFDGKLYAIPYYSASNAGRRPVVWRGDWLKNVGINNVPDTLDQAEKALYKFATDDPDRNGKNDTYGCANTAMDMVFGSYGYIPTQWAIKDKKLVYGGIQPEMKQALAVLNRWYKDKVLVPNFTSNEMVKDGKTLTYPIDFVEGKIGLSCSGYFFSWYRDDDLTNVGRTIDPKFVLPSTFKIGPHITEMQKTNPEAIKDLMFADPVKGPTGLRGMPLASGKIMGAFLGFGKHMEQDNEKMIRIWQMYDYMHKNMDNYYTAKNGIKDKYWKWGPTGVENIDHPEWSEAEKTKALAMGINMCFTYSTPFKFANEGQKLVMSYRLKFNYDKNGIGNEIEGSLPSDTKYKSELEKMRSQAYKEIISGEKPIDYFDEFVKKWREAGGSQLEKEANEWYAANGGK